ncbi:hypothetical protein LWI29_012230 [Acer saccharum]|uniref:Uncharacterized protein n=1 Tax=Acer saccharum TaxID=4024 RepID=A0AA39W652_ACESA|nr:hypothetical protein LWI29_012230 [Acer saccharum]
MGSSLVYGSIADPMFIEAAIFDAVVSSSGSLHVAMAQPRSPLHLQVGTIPASSKALIGPVLSQPSDRVPVSVGVSVHGSVQFRALDYWFRVISLMRTSSRLLILCLEVCQSQQVGQSEDSIIGVLVHSSRMGARPISSEGPSLILDVSTGAVVSISSTVSMVGQGSKVGRDFVSPLVSFAQPIVSSVVSVDELDDRHRRVPANVVEFAVRRRVPVSVASRPSSSSPAAVVEFTSRRLQHLLRRRVARPASFSFSFRLLLINIFLASI